MTDITYALLLLWYNGGALLAFGLGGFGLAWCLLRWVCVEREHPLVLLHQRFDGITRWLLLHRRSRKTLPISLALMALGVGMHYAVLKSEFRVWAFQNSILFLIANALPPILALTIWLTWDREPKYVKRGEGRSDSQFRDVSEEWGDRVVEGEKVHTDSRPTAELLVYRDPAKGQRRLITSGQFFGGNLTLLSLRWDILSRHVFLVGPQGSGKTAGFFGPVMLSSLVPWIYQDSKAELPFLEYFQNRPVWGLDVRGHASRSAIWNPMEEIRSEEDFDLLVDYLFPVNPKDNNAWVRDMARVIFGAMLRSRRWESIQELARTLRQSRLESFLSTIDPIYLDTMKEPKSQVPVLQDLVVTLSRWETKRVRTITEGRSTITLDEFIARGGYVMNCEASDALKTPVRVFWAMLLGRLRNRPEGASKVLLLLDEFGDCGRIPDIQKALVLLRSKGVSVAAGIQNLGLLQDVYPQDWRAVMEGFGTRVWLARNLDDDLRQRLSQSIGKFTRRIPAANKNSRETEKECELMPVDAWGRWSELRVALGRLHGFTYWFPVPIDIPKTPLGAALATEDPWGDSEIEARVAAREALQEAGLPEWCLEVPGASLMESSPTAPIATDIQNTEEDWL